MYCPTSKGLQAQSSFVPWGILGLGCVTLFLTLRIYGPLIHLPFVSDDQFYFFSEMQAAESFSQTLRLIFDYSQNRMYGKVDFLFFRPLFFFWLAVQHQLFSYHFTAWNLTNMGLHLVTLGMFFRVLRTFGPPFAAALTVLFFSVLEAPGSLILNPHSGGYFFAMILWLEALCRMDGLTKSREIARLNLLGYLTLLSIGVFFFEMTALFSVVMAAILFWERTRRFGKQSIQLFLKCCLPAILFFWVYGIRWLLMEQPLRVFQELALTASGVSSWLVFKIALASLGVDFRMWLPGTMSFTGVIWTIGITALILVCGMTRKRLPMAFFYLFLLLIYKIIVVFLRMQCTVDHAYWMNLLLLLSIHSMMDWNRFSGWRALGPMLVLGAWIFFSFQRSFGYFNAYAASSQRLVNYFGGLSDFVDGHKKEPEFSFQIENPSEDIDKLADMSVGYSDARTATVWKRLSEIYFASYYKSQSEARYRLQMREDGTPEILK